MKNRAKIATVLWCWEDKEPPDSPYDTLMGQALEVKVNHKTWINELKNKSIENTLNAT